MNFENFENAIIRYSDEDVLEDAVYIEKLDSCWGEDDAPVVGLKEYVIYLGPVDDEKGLSGSASFKDEFIIHLFQSVGIQHYYLHSSENSHTLYFRSDNEANDKYAMLLQTIANNKYRIIGDNY